MANNKVLLTTLGITTLFSAVGVLLIALSHIARSHIGNVPHHGRESIRLLVLETFPLTAGIVNGGLVLTTAAFVVLGLLSPVRTWLKMGGYLVTLCGVFSLCLGVYLWIMTLRFKDSFQNTYLGLKPETQSLIQQTFQCCGYHNATTPAFITDSFCSSPAAAALARGCGSAVSSYANIFIDYFFTSLFGIVGLDAVLILSIACLLKDRKERERYRHIDEKSGFRTF
ncbi:hypothetical protein E4U21_006823 [Claviceps maximensis]|nr:hypothetical protein E4U21_006823 [Claviceps maximensis]